jgi:hypothetical protein
MIAEMDNENRLPADGQDTGPAGGTEHVVRQGDSTTSLAFQHGLFWQTIWNHPANAQLRRRRGDQNVLLPGDRVFIPDVRTREESGATEQRHRFRRRGMPERLNVQFLDLHGDPLADETYRLEIDGRARTGKLDGDGWLRVGVPPDAYSGRVEVGQEGELASCELQLGHLDPVSETTGVQARLRNLGYYDGPVDGEDSDELARAVAAFRAEKGMNESGEMDEAFRGSLKDAHGV